MGDCPGCGAPNPGGARFCATCGASLVPACRHCGAELPDGARFCPACGTAVEEPLPSPTGQERRLVTILFADVASSTALGERLDPERLQEILATYFSSMREEIEAEGGTVEKFIGDAVMAAFGVPTAHEDDPARALRAALRMRRRLSEVNRSLQARLGVELAIRTGVNTGDVLAAIHPRPGEPMVTGDAVNAAARLEQSAQPGEIVVAERTARATRGFRFRELGPRALRGKERAVPALLLIGEAPPVAERGVPGLQAPMVGRERELGLLRALYERVAGEGRPHLVTVYGDPGVGKSRLTREFLGWAGARDSAVVQGRCLPYGEGITYWPLAEILKARAGILDTDPPPVVLAKTREACETIAYADAATCSALAYTVGVDDPDAPMPHDPREARNRMHAAWRGFFTALSTLAPVVVVIEDIHWADPALLDLIEDVAERTEGPVLFVCPSRPDLTDRRPTWGGGRRNASNIGLDPLTREEADRLIALLLDVEDLPADVHARILERAEGNPFFLEEIVRHLIDEGRIAHEGGRWRATEGLHDIEIPDTVQGVLAARIDLLGAPEKRTLQLAAVVGRVFWPAPVGLLLNGQRKRLDEILIHLEERDLVRSRVGSTIAGEPEFIFKHVLTRDVAYESLPRRERGRAHAAVASWIESTAGERRSEFVELLAYHYEEAFRAHHEEAGATTEAGALRVQAFDTLLEAAVAARRRFAIHRSLRLAERASELAVEPVERARALETRGATAIADYQGDLAWSTLREAIDLRLAHVPDDARAIARSCARAVENPLRWPGSMTMLPSEDEVMRYVEHGLAHAAPGSTERIRLLTARSFAPFGFAATRGTTAEEVDAAERAGLEAADLAIRLGRPDLASAALDGAISGPAVVGMYERTLPMVDRRLELVSGIDDPWEVGDAYAMAAWSWVAIGEYERARDLASLGRSRMQAGAEGVALHCLSWEILSEFQLGGWRRIREELLPTLRARLGPRAEDPPYFMQNAFGVLALITVARGEADADRSVEILRRLEATAHLHPSLVLVRTWLAWAELRRGRHETARGLLDRARSIPIDAHRHLLDQVEALALAETERWDAVPAFLEATRAYSTAAGLRGLPLHADRLEGRWALATGDPSRAADLLSTTAEGFARLHARWETAVTELTLAEALVAQGRPDRARDVLARPAQVFDELGTRLEIERSRALLARAR